MKSKFAIPDGNYEQFITIFCEAWVRNKITGEVYERKSIPTEEDLRYLQARAEARGKNYIVEYVDYKTLALENMMR